MGRSVVGGRSLFGRESADRPVASKMPASLSRKAQPGARLIGRARRTVSAALEQARPYPATDDHQTLDGHQGPFLGTRLADRSPTPLRAGAELAEGTPTIPPSKAGVTTQTSPCCNRSARNRGCRRGKGVNCQHLGWSTNVHGTVLGPVGATGGAGVSENAHRFRQKFQDRARGDANSTVARIRNVI